MYPKENVKTASIERSSNSKSSVVVLYQGESFEAPKTFSKQLVQPSKSDRSVVRTSNITSDPSPVR